MADRIGNVSSICIALSMPKSTYYRLLKPPASGGVMSTRGTKSHRSLTDAEVANIIDVLHQARFLDKAPAYIYAELLDEGIYLCSISTLYRILRSLKEVGERRRVLRHPNFQKPELLATSPNQVWSWDITKRAPRPLVGVHMCGMRNARKEVI